MRRSRRASSRPPPVWHAQVLRPRPARRAPRASRRRPRAPPRRRPHVRGEHLDVGGSAVTGVTDEQYGAVLAGSSDASSPVRSFQGTVRALLSVVAPTTLVVGLLFYFGWARTNAQAHALGLDDSLFGYSTRDYILNSVSSMYWPLFV